MKNVSFPRRKFVLALSAAAASAGWPLARAQDRYPSRTVQIIAPFPAGGSADYFARVVAQRFAARTGASAIIEPKPGASGILGTRQVIASAPDGYTLVSTSVASALVPPALVKPRAFDHAKDLIPITPFAKVPSLIVAAPQLGVRDLAELVRRARAAPGKLSIASSGTGTVAHLAAEMLKREAKVDIVHVPYKGAPPAVNDLLGGHAHLMFSDASFFIEHVRGGKLVPLAAGSTERIPALPNVPTTAEAGYPGLVAENIYGLFAPAGTPRAVVQRLHEIVVSILAEPEVREAYAKQTATPLPMTPEAFAGLMESEGKKLIPLALEVAVN